MLWRNCRITNTINDDCDVSRQPVVDGSIDNKIKPEEIPDNAVPPLLPTMVSDDSFDFITPVVDPIPGDNMEVGNNFTDVIDASEASKEFEIDEEECRDLDLQF